MMAFLFLSPMIVFSHNIIKGKVICEQSSTPLPGASIQLVGTDEGTVTDDWGNFTIDTDYESGTLLLSFLGYKSLEIDFTSHTEFLVIDLKPDVIDLGTVKVCGSKISPMSTISQLDVKIRTVNTSQDVLRIIPGLFIAQHAGGGKSEQIFLRGFDADHGTDVNVSVDGLPVNMVSQAHGQGYADLHFLIPELIREVDFAKGPFYADKGDFATAGYVEFKTISILEDNIVKTEIGKFNSFRTVGLFNLLGDEQNKSGKNAFVAMEYFITDGPFKSPQNFNRMNLFAKYNNIVNQKNMFTITASMFNSKWDQSGQLPQQSVDDGSLSRWGSMDPTEGGLTQRINLSVKSMHQMDNGGSMSNLIYYTRYNFDLYSNFTYYLDDIENGDQIRQKEKRNLYGYSGKYQKTISIKKDNVIETQIGGGFRFDEIMDSQLLNTKDRFTVIDTSNFGDIFENNINVFGNVNWKVKKWSLNFGLRFNVFKFEYSDKTRDYYGNDVKYQNILSPKINISYNFTDQFQLYAKLGKGFHSNDARVVTRNDSISSLPAAYGADLGINWKPGSRLLVNTALWFMNLEQELVWSGDGGCWEPSGETNRLGVDLSIRWQMANYLFVDADVNYCYARSPGEKEGENYIPLAPLLTSTGGISWIHPNGFNLSLRYRFMGDRPADETNEVTAKGYFVADLNAAYSLKKHWTFGVSVENLFDVDWNEAQFAGEYRTSPFAEAEYGLTFTPGIPFYLKAGISYLF